MSEEDREKLKKELQAQRQTSVPSTRKVGLLALADVNATWANLVDIVSSPLAIQ